MDKKKKIALSVLVIITLIAIIFTVIKFTSHNENNIDSNLSQNINDSNTNVSEEKELPTTYIEEEKTFETLTFSDIKIVEKSENENVLTANIKNNSLDKIERKIIDVELFKEDGSSFGSVGGILPEIEPEGTGILEIPIALGVMDTIDIVVREAGNSK